MDNLIFQNIDTSENNPIQAEKPVKTKTHLNKKIILLISLASVIIILLIISAIVSRSRQNTNQSNLNNIPTVTTSSNINQENPIPTQFVEKFNQIEKKLVNTPDLLPPEIDLKMGLN